jgi:hypothetical protein
MTDICRFPPTTLSSLVPYHMASSSNASSSTSWWNKGTGSATEEGRINSTSSAYQPLPSGDRIVNSLSQLETRASDFNSSPNLSSSKDSRQSPPNDTCSGQPTGDSISSNDSKKHSRDWSHDVVAEVQTLPTVDEPEVKRRATLSSIREHEGLFPENRIEELSDDAGSVEEGEEGPTQFGHHKTPSDPSAERRKAKRFRYVRTAWWKYAAKRIKLITTYSPSRLTHNQTRFLMSEFTRQAHPDAAHRERLSREIPGLSPRQVQVWFQNR